MKLLNLPQLRQTYGYDCGAKALQTVLAYYGVEQREDALMEHAHTTTDGTPIAGVVREAIRHGFSVDSRTMTLQDVTRYIDKGIPVILVLQAWSDAQQPDYRSDWSDGHYVVAIGYTRDQILFEDPSSFQRTYLTYDELEQRWHDTDTTGTRYVHHGIAILGKSPRFQPNMMEHMD